MLAALLLALSGCIEDELLYAGTPDSDVASENTSSSGTSSSGGSSASGTETAPVVTVEEVSADQIANTTFDRTIRVVYAAAGATVS